MTSEILSKKAWTDRIIILGDGYIGRHIFNSLEHYDCKILGSKDLDYHDPRVLTKYILNSSTSIVINCSGFTGRPNVDEGEIKKEECWRLNVLSPLSVNEVCERLAVKYIHISSGCIYDRYIKDYTETDKPNFGLFDTSSFYSKSKHAFELLSSRMSNKIIRIRMPISPDTNPRNYLTKIKNYDNIIDMKNSKTYIPDLCNFIKNLMEVDQFGFWRGQDIYNVVNPNPISTMALTVMMAGKDYHNPNWNIVHLKDLKIVAPRSNCVLNGDKANKIYNMRDESEIILEALTKINPNV